MRNLLEIEGQPPYAVDSDSELVTLLTGLFLGVGFGTHRAEERAEDELARLPEGGDEIAVNLPDGRTVRLWTEN